MQSITPRSSVEGKNQPIYALLCRSTAQNALTSETLESVRTDFLKHHSHHDVTGVLLYADGFFLHYLEGPQPSIQNVLETIAQWPWHSNTQCHTLPTISQRMYATWSFTGCADWSPIAQAPHWLDVG